MKKAKNLLLFFLIFSVFACTKTPTNKEKLIAERVDSVLKLMTIEEKIGQLTLFTSDYDVTGPTIRENYK
ncbi:MAG: Periplasmic beta-glucosidase, partial [Bacteroidetes bacterium 38_7]